MPDDAEPVRRGFDAWNRGDLDALGAFVAPNVEIDASARILNPATYRGIDGARRFQEEIGEVWEDFRVEVEDVRAAGDGVFVVFVNSTGRGRTSQIPGSASAAWHVTIRDGRATHLKLYRDRAEALAAAGLGE